MSKGDEHEERKEKKKRNGRIFLSRGCLDCPDNAFYPLNPLPPTSLPSL